MGARHTLLQQARPLHQMRDGRGGGDPRFRVRTHPAGRGARDRGYAGRLGTVWTGATLPLHPWLSVPRPAVSLLGSGAYACDTHSSAGSVGRWWSHASRGTTTRSYGYTVNGTSGEDGGCSCAVMTRNIERQHSGGHLDVDVDVDVDVDRSHGGGASGMQCSRRSRRTVHRWRC